MAGCRGRRARGSSFITTAAFAEVHIVDDPGGEVSEYRHSTSCARRESAFVIDGPCLSACTLFTGIIRTIMLCNPPRCARLSRRLVLRRCAAYAGAEPPGNAGCLCAFTRQKSATGSTAMAA